MSITMLRHDIFLFAMPPFAADAAAACLLSMFAGGYAPHAPMLLIDAFTLLHAYTRLPPCCLYTLRCLRRYGATLRICHDMALR